MKVLDGCHSAELGGGHFGRVKTLLKISERFYWIGMVNDVKEYCKTCEKCQKANRPLPETQKGNKYIMTVSCLFSKWPEATALPDKTATGGAEFLFFVLHKTWLFEWCDKPEDLQQTIIECNTKTMVDVRKKALENIMKAQGRQKVYYNQVHCKDREKYKVGTLVLIKNSKKLSKKGSKMEPNWTGPYLIHEVLSKGTYRLSKPNSPFQVLAQKYNMTRLKIFYQKVQVDVGVEDEEQQTSNVQAVLEDPNGWLDDEHITAAQHLLQEQHPDVAGLQSTSLQYTRTFEVLRDHPFIQCLHENGNHWITVPTVGCSSGVVQVFDSSHHLKLSHSLKCIIADMLQASKDSIVLEYIKMQEQSGASDCGLFAIATATAICNGQDLCMLEFDQYLMRKHLLQCFQNGAMLPFPSQSIAARKPKVLKEEMVEIYCHCRLPYTGRKMVQCDGCQKWFHCDCLRVSPRRSTNWYCSPICSKTV
eukprot:Em0019g41a